MHACRFLVVAGLALAACSTDQFVGPDASEDAATDSPPTDAGGGDAPGQPCNPTSIGCAGGHLCTSFDTGNPPEKPFTKLESGSATAEVSSDRFESCPNALRTTLQAAPPDAGGSFGGIIGSFSVTTSTGAASSVHLAVRLPNAIGANSVAAFALTANGDNKTAVGVVYTNGGWALVSSVQTQGIKPLVGGWNTMTLTAHYSVAGSGQAELSYLDSNSQTQTANVNLGFTGAIQSLDTAIGVTGFGGVATPTDIWFDDVDFGPAQ